MQQIFGAAAKDTACCAPGNHPAQSVREDITKTTTEAARGTAWAHTRLRRRGRRRAWLAGEALQRLVSKQTEKRHGDRGHAAGSRRTALSMRPVLHSIQNIHQTHIRLHRGRASILCLWAGNY